MEEVKLMEINYLHSRIMLAEAYYSKTDDRLLTVSMRDDNSII